MIAIMLAAAIGGAPWLSEADHKKVLADMPKGVPIPENLQFYKLPQKSQSLIVLNGAPHRSIVAATTQENPWVTSGGMHWVDKKDWHNVTGLALPKDGKIKVWSENVDAGAPQPVPRIRWAFPEGTVAFDVLFFKDHIFEIRTQTKKKAEWDSGEVYRPDMPTEGSQQRDFNWKFYFSGVRSGFDVLYTIEAKAKYRVVASIPKDVKFVSGQDVVTDMGPFMPWPYVGTGTTCAHCHTLIGRRTGYGSMIRGDDGRFSWHPWGDDDNIDGRWPVSVAK